MAPCGASTADMAVPGRSNVTTKLSITDIVDIFEGISLLFSFTVP